MNLCILQWIWIVEILLKAIVTDAGKNINTVWQSELFQHFGQIGLVMHQQSFYHMVLCDLNTIINVHMLQQCAMAWVESVQRGCISQQI